MGWCLVECGLGGGGAWHQGLHLHGVGLNIKGFASRGAWLGVAWERGGAWRQGLPLHGVGFGGAWLGEGWSLMLGLSRVWGGA